ncbi:MAG: F0F1 ATP synthase subunit A [Chitinophagaceae bacterium]|nr:F0F1 ATP synthase subunit A [Chitinophagaceae bacterium]
MNCGRLKSFTIAVFSLFITAMALPLASVAQQGDEHQPPHDGQVAHDAPKKEGFNATEVIFGHVLNGHEFHFMDITGDDGVKHPVSIPLPIILYSPQKGFTSFMSSKFEHGHKSYEGYTLLTAETIEHMGLDPKKYNPEDIVAVTADGKIDESVTVYDLSLTRNVVQMLLALTIFTFIMLRVARRYKSGVGVTTAPRGAQSLLEPIINFVDEQVVKPNLGHKSDKYLPFMLTIFFFILVNNIVGLIPGSANVTGNIAFTAVLGVIAFVVILFSSNKHFWGHIFNPPGVPFGVKLILVPVEFLGIFIKPFALIIRLFANMLAGHIIIICLISLIFIFGQLGASFGWGASPLAIGFTVFIYLIEVLVAFLQAFIFSMLAAVFIGQAFEGEHHHDEAHGHDHRHDPAHQPAIV